MTHDDVIRLAIRQPRVFEHCVATTFGVLHREARNTLRELKESGHLVGGRRHGYSLGYVHAIRDRIDQVGTVTDSDLADYFGVLPECLERGLAELTDTGQIIAGSDGYQISPKL